MTKDNGLKRNRLLQFSLLAGARYRPLFAQIDVDPRLKWSAVRFIFSPTDTVYIDLVIAVSHEENPIS